ncbi:hypothetical protein HPB50_018460 [Hyalomma asiaticum]|uniref:Uncharacterized protein n=1 Tax=Hyalomma asiaticum TaxID=266040 RepID=A0ACB7TR51_HYAAI|nr:hypothetical protein HPB50_018460 [Hyalomma asiaticum]
MKWNHRTHQTSTPRSKPTEKKQRKIDAQDEIKSKMKIEITEQAKGGNRYWKRPSDEVTL